MYRYKARARSQQMLAHRLATGEYGSSELNLSTTSAGVGRIPYYRCKHNTGCLSHRRQRRATRVLLVLSLQLHCTRRCSRHGSLQALVTRSRYHVTCRSSPQEWSCARGRLFSAVITSCQFAPYSKSLPAHKEQHPNEKCPPRSASRCGRGMWRWHADASD